MQSCAVFEPDCTEQRVADKNASSLLIDTPISCSDHLWGWGMVWWVLLLLGFNKLWGKEGCTSNLDSKLELESENAVFPWQWLRVRPSAKPSQRRLNKWCRLWRANDSYFTFFSYLFFLWKKDNQCNPLTEFMRQLMAKDGHGCADASCQVCTEGGTCRNNRSNSEKAPFISLLLCADSTRG